MPNRTREIIEMEIEAVNLEIFLLEMKDRLSNDDREFLDYLHQTKSSLEAELEQYGN